MFKINLKFSGFIICGLLSILNFNFAQAAGSFSVSPILIDYTTEGRDIISRNITITNNGSNAIRLYASVHEVSLGDKSEILEFVPASMSDRKTSITSWIEISRARIEIKPGEEKTLPITIRIHPETPPGTYHALVGFAEGANRDNIEQKVKSGQASSVIIKISINDTKRTQLHLNSFISDRFSFQENTGQMSYVLENTGDVPVLPTGEIIIYDTTGKELTSLVVNKDKELIQPNETKKFIEPLPFIKKLGKNKAYLAVEYGENNKATVFDTAFYYSIPWLYLAIILFILLLVLTIIAVFFRRVFSSSVDSFEGGVYDLPMFVKESKEHNTYEHDLNLKKDKNAS